MNILTTNEIDNVCIDLVNSISNKYPYYKPHVNLLYKYGCRIGELFNYNIQIDLENNKVIIYPQKKNDPRILPIIDFQVPEEIEQLQLTQDNTYLNKRNLQRIIEKEISIRNLKCGNKNIGAHLFRHNYVRKLIQDGKQISTIDNLMGYTSQSIVDTYAIGRIYY